MVGMMASHRNCKDKYNALIDRQNVRRSIGGYFSNITFAVKDIIDVAGIRTTCGSALLKENVAISDSFIASRILELGGTIIGKTNTDEFAMDATNLTSYFGPCLNPNDMTRICGGSSGGSAASVAGGLSDVGIGTDTGGSTRIPASLCGIFGLKPTTGLIPMDGIIPFSKTLDTVGVMAGDIPNIKRVLLGLIPNGAKIKARVKRKSLLRVGFFSSGGSIESEMLKELVFDLFDEALEIDFQKILREGFNIRRAIVAKESSDFHQKMFGDSIDCYQPQTKKFLEIGKKITDKDYRQSLEKIKSLKETYKDLFSDVDVILCPATEITAPKITEVKASPDYFRELLVKNTGFFNVVFAPSISIPVRFRRHMPIGLLASSIEGEDFSLISLAETIHQKINSELNKK